MSRQVMWVFMVAAVWLLPACGQTPENRIQTAELALDHGNGQLAADLSEQLLATEPEHREALLIRAKAEAMLGRFGAGRAYAQRLLELNPGNADVRQLLIQWSLIHLERLLGKFNFARSAKFQKEFQESLTTAANQTTWLSTQEGKAAEGLWLKARLSTLEMASIDKLLNRYKDSSGHIETVKMSALKVQRENHRKTSEQDLRQAISQQPDLYEAYPLYLSMLIDRGAWPTLWVLGHKLSSQVQVPATLSDLMVRQLIRMPSNVQPRPARLETAARIQQAVPDDQRTSAPWLFGATRLHLARNEHAKARELMEPVLKKYPYDTTAQYLMTQALYGLGEYVAAKLILEKLEVQMGRSSEVLTLYGMTLARTGDTELAKEMLWKAKSINPNNSLAQEQYFDLIHRQKLLPEVEADIVKFYEKNRKNARAVSLMVRYLQSKGDRGQLSQRLTDEVQLITPLTPELLQTLIDGYIYLQQYGAAERFARRLVNAQPDDLAASLRLAETLLLQKKIGQLETLLAKTRKNFPDATGIDQIIGRMHLEASRYDQAVRLLDEVVNAEPSNSEARLMLARALGNLSLSEQALQQIDAVLELQPNDISACALGARICELTEQTERANTYLEGIDTATIDHNRFPIIVAVLKQRLGELDEAAEICTRAINNGNTDPSLPLVLAHIYQAKGSDAKAETQFLNLISAQPHLPHVYAFLVRFFVERERYQEGIERFKHLSFSTDARAQSLAQLSLAAVLEASGRPDKALQLLELFYGPAVKRGHLEALAIANAMARMRMGRQELPKAVAVYDVMVKANMMRSEALLQQAKLMAGQGQREDAVSRLDTVAADLGRSQQRLARQVITAFAQLGEGHRALDLLAKRIELEGEQPALLRLNAEVLLQLQRPGEAVNVLSHLLDLRPKQPALRMRLAHANAAAGRFEAAVEAFDQVIVDSRALAPAALADKALLLLKLGLESQAMATFEQLEAVGIADDPRVSLEVGRVLARLGQYDKAKGRLEAVPLFSNRYLEAQVLLARIESKQGQFQEARTRLSALAQKYPAMVAKDMVAVCMAGKMQSQLLEWVAEALEHETISNKIKLGWLQVKLSLLAEAWDWTAALATFEEMQGLTPEDPVLAIGRLITLVHMGQREAAASLYKSMPKLADSRHGLLLGQLVGLSGQVDSDESPISTYFHQWLAGNTEGAVSAAQRMGPQMLLFRSDLVSTQQRSDLSQLGDAAKHLSVAWLATEAGLVPLALEASSKVVSRTPDLSIAHALFLRAQLRQGQPSADDLAAAQDKAPGSSLAGYLAAREFVRTSDWSAAVEQLRAVLGREPDNTKLQYELANMMVQAGQVGPAIDMLEPIAASSGRYHLVAGSDLAMLLAEHRPDRIDQAHQLAGLAMGRSPANPAHRHAMGWVEHRRGNDELALEHLNKVILADPVGGQIHYHLGAVYRAMNRPEWAKYHLEASLDGPERPWTAQARNLLGQ